jgi:hypothetical protein
MLCIVFKKQSFFIRFSIIKITQCEQVEQLYATLNPKR